MLKVKSPDIATTGQERELQFLPLSGRRQQRMPERAVSDIPRQARAFVRQMFSRR